MDLMSRKDAIFFLFFSYRLISEYYSGCGLMSLLAKCVLIQGLDNCQASGRRSSTRF